MVHWYKRDPDAALAGMIALTLEECGAYNIIIDLLYARDGNVPDDDAFICRHLHCRPQTWRRIKNSLQRHGKLTVNRGQIEAKRVANELESAQKRILKKEVWNEKRNHINGADKNTPPFEAHTTTTTTTPTPTKKEKKEYTLANGVTIALPSESAPVHLEPFDQFWAAYPRKEGKKAAQASFAKAIKETTLERMLATIAWQRTQWSDPKYIPHPTTWLNQGRWDDQPQPKGAQNGSGGHRALQDDSRSVTKALDRFAAENEQGNLTFAARPSLLSPKSESDRKLLPKG